MRCQTQLTTVCVFACVIWAMQLWLRMPEPEHVKTSINAMLRTASIERARAETLNPRALDDAGISLSAAGNGLSGSSALGRRG